MTWQDSRTPLFIYLVITRSSVSKQRDRVSYLKLISMFLFPAHRISAQLGCCPLEASWRDSRGVKRDRETRRNETNPIGNQKIARINGKVYDELDICKCTPDYEWIRKTLGGTARYGW
jgi:hypothetical protein